MVFALNYLCIYINYDLPVLSTKKALLSTKIIANGDKNNLEQLDEFSKTKKVYESHRTLDRSESTLYKLKVFCIANLNANC